jgi:hypothetical protein
MTRHVSDWINMYGDIHMVQCVAEPRRWCHGENPERSLAWVHPRFHHLPGLLWAVTDQCPYGLRSIKPPHRLLKKSTGFVSNSEVFQQTVPKRCTNNHDHDIIEGSYQGRSISKACENYPKPLAKAMVSGMLQQDSVSKTLSFNAFVTLQEPDDPKHTMQYLRQLHVALGHATPAAMSQTLKEAGASSWLIRAASDFSCPLCEAQKTQRSVPKTALRHSFALNDGVFLDFYFVKLRRKDTPVRKVCIMSLLDEGTGLVQYQYISESEPTSELAIKALETSWIPAFGAPKRIFSDEDRVFESKKFSAFCHRYGIQLSLTAANAEHQHGAIEQLHHHARVAIKSAWAELHPEDDLQSLLVELAAAHNELAHVHGVSPNMLAFGQPRRDLPHFGGGIASDSAPIADTLLDHDTKYQQLLRLRTEARTAFIKADAIARLNRAQDYKSRGTHGPYQPGERVMVYRRRYLGKTRAEVPELSPKTGAWYGPAVVLALESSDPDQLRPRLYYVSMFGKLYKCAEHQLRAMSPSAELARRRLEEFSKNGAVMTGGQGVAALKPDQKVKGIDISSETDDPDEVPEPREDEDMQEQPDLWMPVPQGPPQVFQPPQGFGPDPELVRTEEVPAPPPLAGPAETSPNIPALLPPSRPGRQELLDDFPRAALRNPLLPRPRSRSPPRGTEATALPPAPETEKREREEDFDRETELRPKAKQKPNSAPTMLDGRSIPVPGNTPEHSDEGMYTEDYANIDEAFFSTPDHAYAGQAIEITLDVEAFEIGTKSFDLRKLLQEALATTQAARRKVEVKERFLTKDEKTEFRKAKAKEWNSFVDNCVVEIATSRGIDPKRIIGSRWVLTWKITDKGPQAKARLVLLGYQDPDLGKYQRASPTLTRCGRNLIFQIAAQQGWHLFSLDAKNAFLAGDLSTRGKPLYMRVPADLLEALGLDPETIFILLKSAYGLAEAPIAWFRFLRRKLIELGWKSHPLDECVLMRYAENPDKSLQLVGLIGVHVDDLLCCGYGPVFDKAMDQLVKDLPFGERKYGKFVYCGLRVEQPSANLVTVDQNEYIEKLTPMAHKHLANDKRIPPSERTNFKGLCGSLGWAVINTQMNCAFDVSWLASRGDEATGADIAFGNKIMRHMKQNPTQLRFFKVGQSFDDWRMATFHDAGWATRASLHSQAGAAIFIAEAKVLKGELGKAAMIDWLCAKIERVVRSSFEAEINSAQLALDAMEYVHAFIMMCLYGDGALKYRQTTERHPAALVGDNKGLFTAIQAANPITTKGEKRLTIDKVIMKDHLEQHKVTYHWTNSGHQLADGFTKLSSAGARSDLLLEAINRGTIRIAYSEVSGKKEASARYKQQTAPAEEYADQMFSLCEDDEEETLRDANAAIDSWDQFFDVT